MTIEEILKKSIDILKKNKIEDATLKAKILLAFVLKKSKEYLIIHSTEIVEERTKAIFNKYIEMLIQNVPIQYITCNQEFMKLKIYVNENVLIPRADTEILVEEVINIAKKESKTSIVDLCTGSGAIAVSLAKYIQNSKVEAVDISKEALKVARKNAINNQVEIEFYEMNILKQMDELKKYDIIVSNPPYIETDTLISLDEQVKKEPILALDGGKDGLIFYKEIINKAFEHLNIDGYLCMEIGYNQKKAVEDLLKAKGKYKNIYSKTDLSGNDRIVVAQKGR